jgi:hypothetical protein
MEMCLIASAAVPSICHRTNRYRADPYGNCGWEVTCDGFLVHKTSPDQGVSLNGERTITEELETEERKSAAV